MTTRGEFFVLETVNGPEYISVLTDQEGKTIIFETPEEAFKAAAELQEGRVIEYGRDFLTACHK